MPILILVLEWIALGVVSYVVLHIALPVVDAFFLNRHDRVLDQICEVTSSDVKIFVLCLILAPGAAVIAAIYTVVIAVISIGAAVGWAVDQTGRGEPLFRICRRKNDARDH